MTFRLSKLPTALCAAVVMCVSSADAQSNRTTVPPPTAQQIVLARQAALEMAAITVGSLKWAMRDGKEAKTLGFYTGALVFWARALPSMFPSGTGMGETAATTGALSDLWMNRRGFEEKNADFVAAVTKLNEMVKSNDTAGFTSQLAAIKDTCDACHKDYKTRD
jgi:cytochrome c556